jgi:hypothetical protein
MGNTLIAPIENRLLIRCGKYGPGMESGESITALLGQEINWPSFIELSQWHGLMPLIYYALNRHKHLLDSQSFQTIEQEYRLNYIRNLDRCQRFLEVLAKLKTHGIIPVLFKGPVLSQIIYGDIGMRQFTDFDLFIKQPQLDALLRILLEHGFRFGDSLSPAQRKTCLASHGQLCLVRDQDALQLDLHSGLAPQSYHLRYDLDQLTANCIKTELLGAEVTTFRREDHLIISCLHGAMHHWRRLKMLCDVNELQFSAGMDWSYIQAQARQMRIMGLMVLALHLAKLVFGGNREVAPGFNRALTPGVRRIARGHVANFTARPVEHPGALRALKNYVLARESLLDRVVCTKWLLFNPNPEDLAQCLEGGGGWLNSIKRPWRVLKKHGI